MVVPKRHDGIISWLLAAGVGTNATATTGAEKAGNAAAAVFRRFPVGWSRATKMAEGLLHVEQIGDGQCFHVGKHVGEEGRVVSPPGRYPVCEVKRQWRELIVRALVVEGCEAKLLEMVGTGNPASSLASLLHRRQKEADQHPDDGDHDKKLDEGETVWSTSEMK